MFPQGEVGKTRCHSPYHLIFKLKRFYYRETITAFNYEICIIKWLLSHLPFHATQIINPFLKSRTAVNHEKVGDFQLILWNPYKRGLFIYCKISFIQIKGKFDKSVAIVLILCHKVSFEMNFDKSLCRFVAFVIVKTCNEIFISLFQC